MPQPDVERPVPGFIPESHDGGDPESRDGDGTGEREKAFAGHLDGEYAVSLQQRSAPTDKLEEECLSQSSVRIEVLVDPRALAAPHAE